MHPTVAETNRCCGYHSVAFMATDERKAISKKAAAHHEHAAEAAKAASHPGQRVVCLGGAPTPPYVFLRTSFHKLLEHQSGLLKFRC